MIPSAKPVDIKDAIMSIDIYPAIDLRHGQVVRLQLGDPNRQTIFDNDPLHVAKQWIESGARWLHVVNLDGAFDEAGQRNWQVLPKLTAAGTPVQFGGGLRTLKDIARAINMGVSRVILGTVAVEKPDIVAEAVCHFGPERIAIGIDAREGRVKTRGWQSD
jgi:phosphoribosylformimino-5-aminoimidazole carboxamide ribotide isomerase